MTEHVSTASGVYQDLPSNELLSLLNNQVQIVGVVSSFILGVVGIILALVGYIIWNSNEIRKKAQSDAKKIEEIRNQSIVMTDSIQDQLKESKRIINELEGSVQGRNTNKFNKLSKIVSNIDNEMNEARFNFFITEEQLRFLNSVSRSEKIPRSVYLRRLVDAEMKKEKFSS